jgi:hypothetical protein
MLFKVNQIIKYKMLTIKYTRTNLGKFLLNLDKKGLKVTKTTEITKGMIDKFSCICSFRKH